MLSGGPPSFDDDAMLQAWLAVFVTRSRHTARSYLREALRFRLLLVQLYGEDPRRLALAGEHDVLRYEQLLLGKSTPDVVFPFPIEATVLARHQIKAQPFAVAHKSSSVMQAVSVLHALYEFFRKPLPGMDDLYVRANPVSRVKKATAVPRQRVRRILPEAAIRAMLDCASERKDVPGLSLSDRERYRRVLWIVRLLLSQWLRREEAALLRMGDFMHGENGWEIRVQRKGRKEQYLPALSSTMQALMAYRESLGLPSLPAPSERTAPAIRRIKGQKSLPVQPLLLYTEVRWLATETTNWALDDGRLTDSERQRLLECSPHWFRHSGVSRALNAGKDVSMVSRMAGHESVNTTTGMYFSEDTRIMRSQMEDADLA